MKKPVQKKSAVEVGQDCWLAGMDQLEASQIAKQHGARISIVQAEYVDCEKSFQQALRALGGGSAGGEDA